MTRRSRLLFAAVAGALAAMVLGGIASAAFQDPGDASSPRRRPASRSFAWALSLDEDKPDGYIALRRVQLAGTGADWSRVGRGVYYARELAEMAWDQRQDKILFRDLIGLEGKRLDAAIQREERRRARNLARWGVSRTPTPGERYGGEIREVVADVTYARTTLFGDIGDAQIRNRLRRFAAQSKAEPRYCAVAECANRLPPTARVTRRLCDPCRAGGKRQANG